MDIRCERCHTEYELEDSSLAEDEQEVQCTCCGYTFMVTRPNTPAWADEQDSPQSAEWLLQTSDGQLHRFRTLTLLQKWIIERRVTREDRISRTGHSWRRLGDMVELTPFFTVVDEADSPRAGDRGAVSSSEAPPVRRGGQSVRAPVMHSAEAHPDPAVPFKEPFDPTAALNETDVDVDDVDREELRHRPGGIVVKVLVVLGLVGAMAYVGVTKFWRPSESPHTAVQPKMKPNAGTAASITKIPSAPPTALAAEDPGTGVGPASGEPAPSAPESPAAPVSYNNLIAQADQLLENGANARARALYTQALKMREDGVEALSGLGFTALDRGITSQAIAEFERALAFSSRYGPALFGIAETYRSMGNTQTALDRYRRYVEVAPQGDRDAMAARRQIATLEARLESSQSGGPGSVTTVPTQ
jgi:predicted Zn finger-like uncharacterized protein